MSEATKCEWRRWDSGQHETECGQVFEFSNDGVAENKFKFCPFCGGGIVEVAQKCEHEFDAVDLPCAYCGKSAEELGLSANKEG